MHCKTLQHRVKRRRGQLDGKAGARAGPAGVKELQERIRELEQESGFPKRASALFAANQARWASAA